MFFTLFVAWSSNLLTQALALLVWHVSLEALSPLLVWAVVGLFRWNSWCWIEWLNGSSVRYWESCSRWRPRRLLCCSDCWWCAAFFSLTRLCIGTNCAEQNFPPLFFFAPTPLIEDASAGQKREKKRYIWSPRGMNAVATMAWEGFGNFPTT